jgi:hypothetical protein
MLQAQEPLGDVGLVPGLVQPRIAFWTLRSLLPGPVSAPVNGDPPARAASLVRIIAAIIMVNIQTCFKFWIYWPDEGSSVARK